MPYNSPYTLPIPTRLQPKYTGMASNINYPDVSNSALFAFAGGATMKFGLRFSGATCARCHVQCMPDASEQPHISLE